MKGNIGKDIGISSLVAFAASLVAQGFWLACEKFPPPTQLKDGTLVNIIFDDRPLILSFNWYERSKVVLFILIFIYTFAVALISRRVLHSVPSTSQRNAGDRYGLLESAKDHPYITAWAVLTAGVAILLWHSWITWHAPSPPMPSGMWITDWDVKPPESDITHAMWWMGVGLLVFGTLWSIVYGVFKRANNTLRTKA